MEKGEFESVVALVRLGKPFCSGIALSPTYILTAAHCLENKSPNTIYVYEGLGKKFGKDPRMSLNATHSVISSHLHPSLRYSYPNGPLDGLGKVTSSDLAILEISEPLKTKKFFKLLTDPKEILENVRPGEITTAVGFGYTGELGFIPDVSTGVYFGLKKKAQIPIYKTFYNEIDMRNKETDTCYVDSGGPVFKEINGELKILAIVSASLGFCAEGKYATLYSLAFNSACWIHKVTGVSDEFTDIHCGRNDIISFSCFNQVEDIDMLNCANTLSDEILKSYIQ